VVALESVNLFRSLVAWELQALRAITQERQFPSGREIFREGNPGDGVYVIKDGLVEISGSVGGQVSRALSQLGPGEVFGEMAVIEEQPRSATVTALKETVVYFIPRDEMLALLQLSPTLTLNVLQEISRRLREFNQVHLRKVVQAESLAVLGNIARSIVHDLKTPLTIISLSAETAGMPGVTPEKQVQALERIRKQVRRINDMVSDILELNRSRQSDANFTTAVYAKFISEMLPDLQAEVGAKSANIELQNEPPAVNVQMDARRLRRVFYNLLHNSTDAMLDGGRIILRFHAEPGEIVTEIEDTGPGVAPEIAGRLFEPFVTSGKTQGTGLGLSICKKIVEDHRGRIWARHEPSHGAIFCFSLPLAK
jgi:signal transduction histidine kinase